ncbi:MAG: magnesium transporter CorA family protein [Oscillospiraceae bacterium]|nr:magnesium transporter CorA family protein [Oscillospiraceae bacterium]
MTKIYLTQDGVTDIISEPTKDCWICMTNPSEEELEAVQSLYNIDPDDLSAALDEEETSRIDVEDNYTLILIDIPTVEVRNDKNRYVTIPLGIILLQDSIITVCLEDTPLLNLFTGKRASQFSTHMKSRFIFQILFANAKLYLRYLRSINKQSESLEKSLHDSTENSVLIDMMELGKSLLYFTTSLKATDNVLDKLTKTPTIKRYPEDEELLEDVIVENHQALEMSEIYSGILNGMMDAYASIISNNMNVVQKFIAVATVVLSIPNIVFGAYGMNLALEGMPLARSKYAFFLIIIISVILSYITYLYFQKKKMY